jgi:hypothetical protein
MSTDLLPPSDLADPLDKRPIGDMEWMIGVTGWSHDKISRLARLRILKGAFQAQPGKRGAVWHFRKAKTLAWLDSLEVK